VFEVRQSPTVRDATDLALRAGRPANCSPTRRGASARIAAVAPKTKKAKPGALWATSRATPAGSRRRPVAPMRELVPRLARVLPAAVALIVGGAVAPAADARSLTPLARATPPTGVSNTVATLTGLIASGSGTLYQFEYGTGRYSEYTPIRAVGSSATDTPVSATITGLKPATVYHFRLVALGWGAAGISDRQSFTTGSAVPLAPVAPAAPIPAPVAPGRAPVPPPVVGKTMVVAPVAGTVRVRAPGKAAFTPLTAGSAVPVGATVDTRAGTVELTSALGGGRTQAATFRGAMFQVRQSASAKAKGMTDLVLRGGSFAGCPTRGSHASGRAAVIDRRRPPVRRLWAKDRGGRFRTHGRNSVATVRGTRWVTTDTCAGTRTTVTEGAVAVRDLRRKKTVLVRAGRGYLARSR
jgi:hypothetical protein